MQNDLVYKVNESVQNIYFMYQGIAGFVLQYKIRETIVYAEINQGDEFGSYAIL